MKYKLNPDHCYLVVFGFFALGAALRYGLQYLGGL